jgi:hypothetical protein
MFSIRRSSVGGGSNEDAAGFRFRTVSNAWAHPSYRKTTIRVLGFSFMQCCARCRSSFSSPSSHWVTSNETTRLYPILSGPSTLHRRRVVIIRLCRFDKRVAETFDTTPLQRTSFRVEMVKSDRYDTSCLVSFTLTTDAMLSPLWLPLSQITNDAIVAIPAPPLSPLDLVL